MQPHRRVVGLIPLPALLSILDACDAGLPGGGGRAGVFVAVDLEAAPFAVALVFDPAGARYQLGAVLADVAPSAGAWRFGRDGRPLDAMTPAPGRGAGVEVWRAWLASLPRRDRAELAGVDLAGAWRCEGSVAALRALSSAEAVEARADL